MRQASSIRGALCGLSAAALFGVSAPLSKGLLQDVTPLMLAALLYLGGGLGLSGYRLVVGRPPGELRLGLRDAKLLVPLIISGGIIGPVLMLAGLARLSSVSTSLLLNLEGPFTIVLAVLFFRERLNRLELGAGGLVMLAAAVLGFQAWEWRGDFLGALAVAGACACWALDNNLTQRLSVKDPIAVVRVKTLGAGSAMGALAFALGQRLPPLEVTVKALLIGGFCYGLSILLDLYALRLLGAGREAAYFATAPFVGAVAAVPLLGERLGARELGAGAAMALGILLLLRARHRHTHAALTHSHVHAHDGAHSHQHDGPVSEPHAHSHRHAALTHDHPHPPDAEHEMQ